MSSQDIQKTPILPVFEPCPICHLILPLLGLPWWLRCKESAYNAGVAGDAGSIPGLGRSPGGRHGNPLQYSCLENPHGQRSLVGFSAWGRKESDMTERLSTIVSWGEEITYKDNIR